MHYCAGIIRQSNRPTVQECWEAPCYGRDPAHKTGTLWVGNGVAWTQVSYCPFCGEAAPKPADYT